MNIAALAIDVSISQEKLRSVPYCPMRTHHLWLRQITKFGLLLMMGASMSADAGWFGFGGTNWKEEVLLHDGSKIVVERVVERGGRHELGQQPPIKEQSIIFNLPITNERITWKSEFSKDIGFADLQPLLVDMFQEVAYVVTHPVGSLSYMKWGSPNPPYVVFKYQNKKWDRITLEELPAEFTTPNLIFSSPDNTVEKLGTRLVKADTVQKIISEYRQPEFKSIVRTPLDVWKPRPQDRKIRTGDGGWLGIGWFSDQPSLEACLKKCAREKVNPQDCPCNTLFKGK